MSLAIDIDLVDRVKVGGEWFNVVWLNGKSTFGVDSYEFVWKATPTTHRQVVHGGGSNGVCAVGFVFQDRASRRWISGPLTAISAVAT